MIATMPTRSRPLAVSLLLVLIFISICLPTGSIFGLNVKVMVFVAFFLSFIFYLATNSSEWPTSSELLFILVFTACLCLWSAIAVINGEAEMIQVFMQFKDIASTVVIAWMCIFVVRRGIISPETVIVTVIYAVVALALMKLAFIVALFRWHIEPITTIESIFGEASLVGGNIAFGLTRMGFSSDIVGGFALFAILCPSVSGVYFRRTATIILIPLLLASGLLSYGRYIWFIEVFAIVAALMIERKFKWLLVVIMGMASLTYVSYDLLSPLLEARFSSEQTTDSDLIRVEQSKALAEEIRERPLFGRGLGTHVNGLIRSEQTRYSYELQWESLLMQVGVVGVIGMFLSIAAASRDLLAARGPAKPWLGVLFALWLLGSWTNPYITSSFAGATFGMFVAMFYKLRHRSEVHIDSSGGGVSGFATGFLGRPTST
jgi:hypothetical protein